MTKYFKKFYKNKKSLHTHNDSNQVRLMHNISSHSDRHTCKTHDTNGQINERDEQSQTPKILNQNLKTLRIPMTQIVLIAILIPHQIHNNYHDLMKSLR